MNFEPESFDIVLSKDVIEHVENYGPILQEMARVSKDVIILSMFIRMWDEPDLISPHPDGYFLNRYNRQRLYRFMALVGFPQVEIIFQEKDDEVLVFRK